MVRAVRNRRVGAYLAGTAILIGAIGVGAVAYGQAVQLQGGPPGMRRLTETQYRNSIKDIFGDVTLGGRFEPDAREDELVAVGAAKATVTPGGLEQYDRMAMGIAQQIVDPSRRDEYMSCKPADAKAPDDACARDFLKRAGSQLFRRPLIDTELSYEVKIAAEGASKAKDFYFGDQLALATLLTAPPFLFVRDQAESDPAGGFRLTSQSKAQRISLLLWGSSPDAELLRASESGELKTQDGLAKQVNRMIASPRFADGVRAFFTDMLQFDEFRAVSKDAALYPNFSAEVVKEAQEQTLRTIVDQLVTRDGDYRNIFTTKDTYITPLLASAYGIRFTGKWGDMQKWQPVTLPASMPEAGILTQISFSALHSSSGKTSPTLRGKGMREVFLCQEIPPPPPDVDFSKFTSADGDKVSVRQAIEMHHANPACAGCHNLMDPLGLALENYDTSGRFRTEDAHQPIDASGALDKVTYKDATGLGQAMHDNPRATSCVATRVYDYAIGRAATANEQQWVKGPLLTSWAASGYKISALMRLIALDPGFYRVVMPPAPVASAPAGAPAQPAKKDQAAATKPDGAKG